MSDRFKKHLFALFLLIPLLVIFILPILCLVPAELSRRAYYVYEDYGGKTGAANSCGMSFGNMYCVVGQDEYLAVRYYKLVQE